jgi:hypothetical protein
MTRETTEKRIAKRTAHDMRAAALRLARERAGEEADPSLTYGCVDWFRYDVTLPPQEADKAQPPAAAPRGAGRGGAPLGH